MPSRQSGPESVVQTNCKKIRDDQGYWSHVEDYVSDHADVHFTHGLCPGCLDTLYPDMAWVCGQRREAGGRPGREGRQLTCRAWQTEERWHDVQRARACRLSADRA